jgi:hypothetical protein
VPATPNAIQPRDLAHRACEIIGRVARTELDRTYVSVRESPGNLVADVFVRDHSERVERAGLRGCFERVLEVLEERSLVLRRA